MQFGNRGWYRHATAFGGALNGLLMMTANLIGFAIGVDGIKLLWAKMIGSASGRSSFETCGLPLSGACLAGWQLLGTSVAVLFAAVQVMLEYR